jgi:hypothetical protein
MDIARPSGKSVQGREGCTLARTTISQQCLTKSQCSTVSQSSNRRRATYLAIYQQYSCHAHPRAMKSVRSWTLSTNSGARVSAASWSFSNPWFVVINRQEDLLDRACIDSGLRHQHCVLPLCRPSKSCCHLAQYGSPIAYPTAPRIQSFTKEGWREGSDQGRKGRTGSKGGTDTSKKSR